MIRNDSARFAILAVLAALLAPSVGFARIVVFRNDANVEIEFSLRKTTDSSPFTEILEPGGRIQFDLDEGANYDICGTAQDERGRTFGRPNVPFTDLVAAGDEVGVDGVLENGKRVALLLKFPRHCRRIFRCRHFEYVLRVKPASAEFKQWFYYNPTPRERYAPR